MLKKYNLVLWFIGIIALFIGAGVFYSKEQSNPKNSILAGQKEVLTNQNDQKDGTKESGKQGDTRKQNEAGNNGASKDANKIMAPDFSLKDTAGNTVKLSDYRGKIVVLNFWAVWCIYCRQETPDLDELDQTFKKNNDVVLLAVDYKEDIKKVTGYLKENNFGIRALLDEDGTVTESYGVTGFPTTIFVNRDGSIFSSIPGKTDKQSILDMLLKMEK